MQQLCIIPLAGIEPDPDQPRKHFDEAETRALGDNMLAIGQQVPVIVYLSGENHVLADGERRWRAASLVGMPELSAIVLPEKPDGLRLRLVQMSLEAHKVGISAWERSCFVRRIREEHGLTVGELAFELQMKQPLVSKLLSCQRLDPAIQKLLHGGTIDLEKAFIVSQEPSPERQREMVRLYAHLPRDQFRQKAKPAATQEDPVAKRARFELGGGAAITVHGSALTLDEVIAALLLATRQLRRAQSQRLDIPAAQKFLKQKAQTNGAADDGARREAEKQNDSAK